MMVRFIFTTVMFVCFFPSSSLLLFYFLFDTVILSQQGSLLFTTRVFLFQHDTKKRPMSRLNNPITPTDFFITGIRLLIFYNLFMIIFDVSRSNWVSTDLQHILFTLLIRTH